jgi:hypothetical protein
VLKYKISEPGFSALVERTISHEVLCLSGWQVREALIKNHGVTVGPTGNAYDEDGEPIEGLGYYISGLYREWQWKKTQESFAEKAREARNDFTK